MKQNNLETLTCQEIIGQKEKEKGKTLRNTLPSLKKTTWRLADRIQCSRHQTFLRTACLLGPHYLVQNFLGVTFPAVAG